MDPRGLRGRGPIRQRPHPEDEGGLAWNDPDIGIVWPELVGNYKGTPSGDGYALTDGTPLKLSEKDEEWEGIKAKVFKN